MSVDNWIWSHCKITFIDTPPPTSLPVSFCLLTCLHHMVHSGETFENSSADRAEDEQGRQAGVAHHGASKETASLIAPLEAPRKDAHEPVRKGYAGVLVPPPVHHQGHIETWKQQQRRDTCDCYGLTVFSGFPCRVLGPAGHINSGLWGP